MSEHTSMQLQLQDLFYISGICGIAWLSYVKHRELKLLRLMAGLNTIQFGTQMVRRFSNWTNTLLPAVQRFLQDGGAGSGSGNRRNYSPTDLFNFQLLGNGANTAATGATIPPPATNARNLNSAATQQPATQTQAHRPGNATVTTSNNGNVITTTTTGEIELDNNQIMNLLLGFTGLGSGGGGNSGLTNRTRNRERGDRGDRERNRESSNNVATTATTSISNSSNSTS